MANNFTSNPWIIDTAAATVLSTDRLRIAKVRVVFNASAVADNQAVVQDKNGKVKHEAFAFQKDTSEEGFFSDSGVANFDGLIVPTCTNAKVYIHLR